MMDPVKEEIRVPFDWKNNIPMDLELHPIEMSRKPPRGMKASYFWMIEGYKLAIRRSEMTVRAAEQHDPDDPMSDNCGWSKVSQGKWE